MGYERIPSSNCDRTAANKCQTTCDRPIEDPGSTAITTADLQEVNDHRTAMKILAEAGLAGSTGCSSGDDGTGRDITTGLFQASIDNLDPHFVMPIRSSPGTMTRHGAPVIGCSNGQQRSKRVSSSDPEPTGRVGHCS